MSDDEREPEFNDSSSDEDEIYDVIKPTQNKKITQAYENYESDDDDYESDINKKDYEDDSEDDNGGGDIDEYDILDENVNASIKKNDIGYDSDRETDDDDDEDIDDSEEYLKKFNENTRKNIITDYYPELIQQNYDEVEALCRIVKNQDGIIIDPLHRTLPFLTKYEKARILGERAKQLNSGAKPVIDVDNTIIDGYLIALKELEEKKIPFIIKRPLPNGGCEYWNISDLEII
jgi:DNA-directed RNA polymerase I, II, and III subunit RPABC2